MLHAFRISCLHGNFRLNDIDHCNNSGIYVFTPLAAVVVARDKVANVLLASKGRGASGGSAHTAQDLARSIAKELLGPLLETACSRLASLLRHAFDIAADSQQLLQGTQCKSYETVLNAA